MYYLGIDIGSLSCDAVLIDDSETILASTVVPTGARNLEAIARAKKEVLASAGVSEQAVSSTISTGYGRDRVDNRLAAVTEITCHARGIHALLGDIDLLVDIGGQDSKTIRLDPQGRVVDFAMNDKCAAGTGRFLEAMARALQVDITELGQLDRGAGGNLTLSSMCTVFAESEVVSLIADGVELKWKASPTADVVQYVVYFGTSENNMELVKDLKRESNQVEYGFTDRRPLKIGRFIYAVEAVDEAANKSPLAIQELRISNKPYPNPFTPLSSNPRFNRVTFSARGLEEAESEFTVKIYDIDGGLVKELITTSGEQELNWDGKNEDGELVESGVYIYQLQVGERYATGTVIVAK